MKYVHFKKLFCLFCSLTLSLSLVGCATTADSQPSTTASTAASEETDSDSTASSEDNKTTPETLEITTFSLPTQAEESSIYVEPVVGMTDEFIRGMDASAVLAEEKSGVVYYNENGEEQDVFMTLAQSGVNYIRIRVWNNPYDENGNGYGGGNNDVATAIELGKRATQYGMKVCIDFHYSDFWADPAKQMCPKAWEGMTVDEKADALYTFTKESLSSMLDAGVNVAMVQVGNETNNGMSGETKYKDMAVLMNAGSKAIRETAESYNHDIQVALHFTDASDYDGIDRIMQKLEKYNVDYDILALSYYPFWHGSFDNLKNVMTNIKENYGKETLIAETSYCYTLEDGDGFGNSVGEEDLIKEYAATVQSQATALRDVCAAAAEVNALGVFYWEGTWIPVGSSASENQKHWEENGSGWASSYASGYDPDDAGKYYGGCSWDNQALFDFTGHPLPSLNVFKYLQYGTITEPAIDYVPQLTAGCNLDSELKLPESVSVVYNDRSLNKEVPVTWDETQVAAIDTSIAGTYTIDGILEDGTAVTCDVTIDFLNYVPNSGFEEEDRTMWTVTAKGSDPTDFQEKEADAHSGLFSFHFWSESDMEFSMEQTITDLPNGTFKFYAYAQGGDVDDTASMELYAIAGGEEKTASFMVDGYGNWQMPEIEGLNVTDGTITIGVRMKCNPKSWGTMDDFTLNLMD